MKKQKVSVEFDAVGAIEYNKWWKHRDHKIGMLDVLEVRTFTDATEKDYYISYPMTMFCHECNAVITTFPDPSPTLVKNGGKHDRHDKEVEVSSGVADCVQPESEDGECDGDRVGEATEGLASFVFPRPPTIRKKRNSKV